MKLLKMIRLLCRPVITDKERFTNKFLREKWYINSFIIQLRLKICTYVHYMYVCAYIYMFKIDTKISTGEVTEDYLYFVLSIFLNFLKFLQCICSDLYTKK